MKNIIKNPLLTFILGLIISGSVVYAATLIASDIAFDNTKTNLSANNVQDAIEELYTKAIASNIDVTSIKYGTFLLQKMIQLSNVVLNQNMLWF